jgi:hypothetical protein
LKGRNLERLTPLFFLCKEVNIWKLEQDRKGLIFLQENRKERQKMKDLVLQTYTIALPVLLGYIVWLLKNQKRDRDANSKGTMLLLRVQLIEYHGKYTQLGNIPSYAYQNFCEMYEAYHELGGNGMVTKMKQEIDELHLKQKGE